MGKQVSLNGVTGRVKWVHERHIKGQLSMWHRTHGKINKLIKLGLSFDGFQKAQVESEGILW